mmetsp:Transcript_60165/g.167883  ORF Transcript_60165/g.167883 Transcript_60165/m.167883 type:complete len:300 (+) Transcript_60165:90-989(+)
MQMGHLKHMQISVPWRSQFPIASILFWRARAFSHSSPMNLPSSQDCAYSSRSGAETLLESSRTMSRMSWSILSLRSVSSCQKAKQQAARINATMRTPKRNISMAIELASIVPMYGQKTRYWSSDGHFLTMMGSGMYSRSMSLKKELAYNDELVSCCRARSKETRPMGDRSPLVIGPPFAATGAKTVFAMSEPFESDTTNTRVGSQFRSRAKSYVNRYSKYLFAGSAIDASASCGFAATGSIIRMGTITAWESQSSLATGSRRQLPATGILVFGQCSTQTPSTITMGSWQWGLTLSIPTS